MAKLGVSILSELKKDYVQSTIDLVKNGVEWIHYDIMDGIFVPNKSFTIEQVRECIEKAPTHFIDVHLMVSDPVAYAYKYLRFADQIVIHHESLNYADMQKLIDELKGNSRKFKLGIAINPKTNVEQIYEFVPWVDFILIMSVEPGKGGQKFIPQTIYKIKKLKKYITKQWFKTKIGVDGGVTIDNARIAANAGADILISGSYITKNMKINIRKFNEEIKK